MSRNNTGNPIGSKAFPDFEDNVKSLDEAVNTADPQWVDRFGRFRLPLMEQERRFIAAQESRSDRFNDFIASSGYQFVGDYGPGIEITEYNQLIRDSNGEFWRVSGQVDLPYATTGAGIPEDDALVPAGDAVLRQDLANPDMGSAMVGFLQGQAGAVSREVKDKLLEIRSPADFGAVGDGVANDTAAFTSLMAAAAGASIVLPKGEYLVDGFTIPAGTTLDANGARFNRRTTTGAAVITVAEGSAIYNAEVDGKKPALGSGSGSDHGIQVLSNGVAIGCRSHDNYGHGIYARNLDFSQNENQRIAFCLAYDNGVLRPGLSGTGDGINFTNSFRGTVTNCVAWGNARTGIVVSTYNGTISDQDPEYSYDVIVSSCHSHDNAFNDINIEAATGAKLLGCHAKGVFTFGRSPKTTVSDFSGGSVYAPDADYPILNNLRLNRADGTSSLFLTGNSPTVSNVLIDPAGSETLTGTSVTVLPPDRKGVLNNIRVKRANNAFRIDVDEAHNLVCETATAAKFIVGLSGQTRRAFNDLKSITGGRVEFYGSSLPTSGTAFAGDIMWNTLFSTLEPGIGWVCTEGGSPGTWRKFGLLEIPA